MAYHNVILVINFLFIIGFGNSFMILTGLVVTAPYFEKWKGMALGLTACGSGAMNTIIPKIMRYLFDTFDFSGALLLYSKVGFPTTQLVNHSITQSINHSINL